MAIGEIPLLRALGGKILTQRLENPYEFLFAKEMKLLRVPISAINSFRHSRSDPSNLFSSYR